MAKGKHKKTRRHSSLLKLPAEVLQAVEDMLLEADTTYDDVKAFLKEKGFDISRSAVVRYGKRFFDQAREMKIMEEQARALISEAGGDGLTLEEANSKLMGAKLMSFLLEEKFDPKALNFAMDAYAKLQRSSVSREKLKSDLEKKVQKTAEAVDMIVKKGGLSEKAAGAIRKQILGIA